MLILEETVIYYFIKIQITGISWVDKGWAAVIRWLSAWNIFGVTPQARTKLRRHEEAADAKEFSANSVEDEEILSSNS